VEDDPQNHVRHIINPQCHFRRTYESGRNRRRVFARTIPDLYGENFAALAGLEDRMDIASAIETARKAGYNGSRSLALIMR
jgi:hypothetical protein